MIFYTGDLTGQVRVTSHFLFLTKAQLFLLKKCSFDFCRLLVDFQSSEKAVFHDYCQCSHCFYGGAGFSGVILLYSRSASNYSAFFFPSSFFPLLPNQFPTSYSWISSSLRMKWSITCKQDAPWTTSQSWFEVSWEQLTVRSYQKSLPSK